MKTIRVHCPSNDKTESFSIAPYQSQDQVLQSIRLQLNIPYAAVFDIQAKPIKDLQKCDADQVVLVAATANEDMQPYAPRNAIMYNGEESEAVDDMLDGYGMDWEDLTDSQKCDHILSLIAKKTTLRNTIRITRPYSAVQKDLQDLATATPTTMQKRYDAEHTTTESISDRWAMKWDVLLPASMRPANPKVDGTYWDERMLATLDILSSFTQGQGTQVRMWIAEAVKARIEDVHVNEEDRSGVVKERDVVQAIVAIYERAGDPDAAVAMVEGKKGNVRGKKDRKGRKKEGKRKTGCEDVVG